MLHSMEAQSSIGLRSTDPAILALGTAAVDHVAKVLTGREHVVSFAGRSQYSPDGGGVSACGLAALNCARVVLGKERDGMRGEQILEELMKQDTVEEILRICLGWSGSHHLDVNDIHQAPVFSRNLQLVWQEYQRPGYSEFQELLRRLQSTSHKCTVSVITRPPEIVCVLKIPCTGLDVFVIFDSHPRSKHPNGAGVIFNTSLSATARYLSDLLRYDLGLIEDPSLQWQAQLLANYSAHIFVSDNNFRSLPDLMEAVLESSLSSLTLTAEVEGLKDKNRVLEMENLRLNAEVEKLEGNVDELKHTIRADKGKRREVPGSYVPINHDAPMVHDIPSASDAWKTAKSRRSTNGTGAPAASSSMLKDLHYVNGAQVYRNGSPIPGDIAMDALLAAQAQQEYEEENRLLHAQAKLFLTEVPRTFHCGICLEDENEQLVARFQPCNHPFCRDCARDYIRSKLSDNKFPILCPACAADKDHDHPGTLDNLLAQTIGLTEDENQTFSELQISAFSILLHCRKCQGSVFVDRQEHRDAKILQCPLPGCSHLWCKSCSQVIELGGPTHSCDGSSELTHLMRDRGWKFCPGCKTPTEKMDGCNHMTCMSPNCNTHFCYVCGEAIVQSGRRSDIRSAVSQHYRRCSLFEDIPDTAPRRGRR